MAAKEWSLTTATDKPMCNSGDPVESKVKKSIFKKKTTLNPRHVIKA